ncbi:hypothetical protein THTE_4036 [Thermogutta terrifontis]|uniref:Uncharacterized protein n=1 Tax=Thermogutta terrifontis TaxID=1331910 RepID=A0A286RL38_9BACT|nr:hypothetical protein THTE_4036 [Thermogutta terrifontis]
MGQAGIGLCRMLTDSAGLRRLTPLVQLDVEHGSLEVIGESSPR